MPTASPSDPSADTEATADAEATAEAARRRTFRSGLWSVAAGVLVLGVALWSPHVTAPPRLPGSPWPLLLTTPRAPGGGPAFSDTLRSLDGATVRLDGFLIAVSQDFDERYILSGLPPGCPFCPPAAEAALVGLPEGVTGDAGVPIVLEGRLRLSTGHPDSLWVYLDDPREVTR